MTLLEISKLFLNPYFRVYARGYDGRINSLIMASIPEAFHKKVVNCMRLDFTCRVEDDPCTIPCISIYTDQLEPDMIPDSVCDVYLF